VTVYAYGVPTDMRKGFDELGALVSQRFGRDPPNGDVYLFSEPRSRARESVALRRDWALHLCEAARARAVRIAVARGTRGSDHVDGERARSLPRWQRARGACGTHATGADRFFACIGSHAMIKCTPEW
jgi:IS66 Orf2 like protein